MMLREFLGPMGMTQVEFARHLRWPYARLNEIVNGKRGVTADTALSFGEALGTGPELWLDLQRDWDLWHEKKRHKPVSPLAGVGA
jgi:addiction module HigA family antidote